MFCIKMPSFHPSHQRGQGNVQEVAACEVTFEMNFILKMRKTLARGHYVKKKKKDATKEEKATLESKRHFLVGAEVSPEQRKQRS